LHPEFVKGKVIDMDCSDATDSNSSLYYLQRTSSAIQLNVVRWNSNKSETQVYPLKDDFFTISRLGGNHIHLLAINRYNISVVVLTPLIICVFNQHHILSATYDVDLLTKNYRKIIDDAPILHIYCGAVCNHFLIVGLSCGFLLLLNLRTFQVISLTQPLGIPPISICVLPTPIEAKLPLFIMAAIDNSIYLFLGDKIVSRYPPYFDHIMEITSNGEESFEIWSYSKGASYRIDQS
jgi:hypothetical protein